MASEDHSEARGPHLRADLRIYDGPRVAGAPSHMLYDPARHRYFQIDAAAETVLSAWKRHGHLGAATRDVMGRDPDDVARIVEFAVANELTEGSSDGWRRHVAEAEASRASPLMWLVHNYLFIKIPLFRPRGQFERAAHLTAWIHTRRFLVFTLLAGVAALYLVSRQWTAFAGTFPAFLSFDGAVLYAATLVGVKVCHELGHACTAARYRCRIGSIGVAFMVMVPMLYCDVTDAWKLSDRRQRMRIDAAGIAAELILAVHAALLWVLLPDGPLRTASFLVATTSVVSSFLVNLNPLMRFDGYLLLSDALNVPNLQTRAFALLRWTIRESLFRAGGAKPDVFPPGKHLFVLCYAVAIVLYRAVVYAGIALIVYHAFFKALGIVLFAVEVGWFLVAPVARELRDWWRLRKTIRASRRGMVSLAAFAFGLALLLVPFRSRVVVPAILEPQAFARVFPTSPGQVRLVAAQAGDRVVAGQTLVVLGSPRIERDETLTKIRLSLVDARLQRRASVREDKSETLALDMERRLLVEKLAALARERADLVLKSPFDGIVRDMDPDLAVGRWLARDSEVALVVAPGAATIRGYVREDTVEALQSGARGTFYPDAYIRRGAPVALAAVAYAAAERIDIPYLASANGGPIPTRERRNNGQIPDYAVYPATFTTDRRAGREIERGTVLLDGARQSVLGALVASVARVLRRESGF